MNVIPLEDKLCERTRRYLDAYVSNELLVETSQEVQKHLDRCGQCSEVLQVRLRIKARLREVVQSEVVPPDARQRVQTAFRAEAFSSGRTVDWGRWSLAAAALLVVCFSGWAGFRLYKLNRVSNDASRQVVQELSLSEQIAGIMRVGVGDHIHCVIDSHVDRITMTPEKMAEKMGPEYYGLVPLIKGKMPDGFVVSVGHRCQVKGREFIHMILKHDEQAVSVIITDKQNLRYPADSRVNSLESQGVILHQDRIESLEAVGFETKDHLAFVVSAMDHKENFQIASRLAPSVSDFLNRL